MAQFELLFGLRLRLPSFPQRDIDQIYCTESLIGHRIIATSKKAKYLTLLQKKGLPLKATMTK